MKHLFGHATSLLVICGAVLFPAATVAGQGTLNPVPPLVAQPAAPAPSVANGAPTSVVSVPADYVIGAEDLLSVVFWRDKELSADVVVRPDGRISLPLLNDVYAVGFTPEQLAGELMKAASKYIEDPTASVIVKEIRSRKVFILGQVGKPGPYPLTSDMTVLQLIAIAGDILEYADAKNITVVRPENGREHRFKFNYRDVLKGKKIEQNIKLKPGDTVIVP
jgi:polysaccharide export outer membrane protein